MRIAAIGKVPLAILAATLAAAGYLVLDPSVKPPSGWTAVHAHYAAAMRLLADAEPAHPLTTRLAARALASHRVTARLRMWTFARQHYDAYQVLIPSFQAKHPGVAVDLQLVSGRALPERLRAAFWADLDVPDLVELEISSAGTMFRGPLDAIGFVDLTDWLKESGWYGRLVQTRFGPWSSRGRIFGLPHDVHPVMVAYRRDIFEAEGVDVSAIETWDDFIGVARKLMGSPDEHGQFARYMMEMSDSGSGQLEVLLFQRGGGYFDAGGRVIFDNAVGLATLKWYVPLVAGPGRIGNSLPGSSEIMTQALEEGYFLCIFTPDWRTRYLFEIAAPKMSGKWALMPLPAFEPGGRRTSTLGGTMIGLTKKSQHKELALELALHLYYDKETLPERFATTNILPPLKESWSHPEFDRRRPYWSNQPIGRLYADLAEQTPPQYTSPFITLAKGKLGEALVACVQYYRHNGPDGFDAFAERVLKAKARYVRRLIERDPFHRAR